MIKKSFYSLYIPALNFHYYHNQGIGTELVKRCIALYPNSEWNLETIPERMSFYKHLGFALNEDPVLKIKCKLF